MTDLSQNGPLLPADEPNRLLTIAHAGDGSLPHLGIAGDTYTILIAGKDTAGRFTVIDMHVPPGGGPPPHRHDFEETFVLLTGELQLTFRGEQDTAKAGDTVNIPANAPHQFKNVSTAPVRMLCICSPAGQDEFFQQIGIPVETRTAPPPHLSEEEQAALMEKTRRLAPRYKTEILREA